MWNALSISLACYCSVWTEIQGPFSLFVSIQTFLIFFKGKSGRNYVKGSLGFRVDVEIEKLLMLRSIVVYQVR